MIVLIEKIADYIIPEDNAIRKGLGEIMGGKILKLRSEELLEQGEAKGRIDAIQNMIDLGLTREQILRKYLQRNMTRHCGLCLKKYSQIHSWHIPKNLLCNADMGRTRKIGFCPFVTIHKSYISF